MTLGDLQGFNVVGWLAALLGLVYQAFADFQDSRSVKMRLSQKSLSELYREQYRKEGVSRGHIHRRSKIRREVRSTVLNGDDKKTYRRFLHRGYSWVLVIAGAAYGLLVAIFNPVK